MKRVMIAGGTGYLGSYLIKAFHKAGYDVIAIARSSQKARQLMPYIKELIIADMTKPDQLSGLMKDIDAVVSTVGITRQKDGLTYMDVDYGCNKNLLNEALISGVDKFMYVAALNGDQLTNLKIMQAKERFVDELRASDIQSYIIRPSGFFSDVEEIFNMASSGRAYVMGQGHFKANPIHGSDLAEFCLEKLKAKSGVFPVGGPQVLSQNDIANIAFQSLNLKPRIMKVPITMVKMAKLFIVAFTTVKTYGPIEFFLTVLTQDMVAPQHGEITIKDHFLKLSKEK